MLCNSFFFFLFTQELVSFDVDFEPLPQQNVEDDDPAVQSPRRKRPRP